MIKYMVCIPNLGDIRIELASFLFRLAQKYGDEVQVMFRSQQPVSVNRNALVEEFLKTTAEWLLFIDSDQAPSSDLLEMCKNDKKVVQAVTCIMQHNIPQPLIMKYSDDRKITYKKIDLMDLKNSEGNLVKVDGVGTGCLLIHRSVFETLEKPYFKFETTADGRLDLSEDYYFSRKCEKADIDLFVDVAHHVGHIKKIDLNKLNLLIYDVTRKNIESLKVGKQDG